MSSLDDFLNSGTVAAELASNLIRLDQEHNQAQNELVEIEADLAHRHRIINELEMTAILDTLSGEEKDCPINGKNETERRAQLWSYTGGQGSIKIPELTLNRERAKARITNARHSSLAARTIANLLIACAGGSLAIADPQGNEETP